jgi:DNA-binding response OmpR family regulator
MLLDLMMPKLSGHDVMRRLQDDPRLMGVRVIVLGARAGEPEVAESQRLGALCHLEKPYEVEELLRRISDGLEEGTR